MNTLVSAKQRTSSNKIVPILGILIIACPITTLLGLALAYFTRGLLPTAYFSDDVMYILTYFLGGVLVFNILLLIIRPFLLRYSERARKAGVIVGILLVLHTTLSVVYFWPVDRSPLHRPGYTDDFSDSFIKLVNIFPIITPSLILGLILVIFLHIKRARQLFYSANQANK